MEDTNANNLLDDTPENTEFGVIASWSNPAGGGPSSVSYDEYMTTMSGYNYLNVVNSWYDLGTTPPQARVSVAIYYDMPSNDRA